MYKAVIFRQNSNAPYILTLFHLYYIAQIKCVYLRELTSFKWNYSRLMPKQDIKKHNKL